jgi:hypothetical protein
MRMLEQKLTAPCAFSSLVQVAAVALLVAAASCGTHRDSSRDDDDGDSGAAGRSTAGRGGSGGTGGAVAPTVACGSKRCAAPQNALAGLGIPGVEAPVACCADSASAQCGSQASGAAVCEPAAVADVRCPGVNLGALAAIAGGAAGNMMSGCCTETNKCGLDGALFGRGCVENGEAASMLSAIPVVGTLIMVPAPKACDAPIDTAADGGSEDAG